MTLPARLAGTLDTVFHDAPPARIGVACSGGGDSMALLHLVAGWARERRVTCHAVTVDHGLRDVAAEVALVARACAALDVTHDVLEWRWDGAGNLQDAARRARREAIADWARAQGVAHVCLGHNQDDQAETVLMRLMRGSGVDGLSGMAGVSLAAGVTWLRPLLGEAREGLRDWLRDEGLTWADDPSNDDPRFDRVRVRQAMTALDLDPARLARTAEQMRAARAVLHQAVIDLAEKTVREEAGELLVERPALESGLPDTRWRLVAAALQYVGGADYRPRFSALADFTTALLAGQGRTLAGVLSRRDTATTMRLLPEHGQTPAERGRPAAHRDNFHRWLASH